MSPLRLATGRLYSIYRVQRGLLQSWIGSRRPQALWLDWTSASNDSQLFSTVSSLSTLFGAGSQAPGCARFYPPQPCIFYVTTAQSWQLDRLLLKTLIITFAQFMLAPNAKIWSFQRKVKLFVISLCPLQSISIQSNFSINILFIFTIKFSQKGLYFYPVLFVACTHDNQLCLTGHWSSIKINIYVNVSQRVF